MFNPRSFKYVHHSYPYTRGLCTILAEARCRISYTYSIWGRLTPGYLFDYETCRVSHSTLVPELARGGPIATPHDFISSQNILGASEVSLI